MRQSDPAALERAARELESLAAEAQRMAARLTAPQTALDVLSGRVSALISGTAEHTDVRLRDLAQAARQHVGRAASANAQAHDLALGLAAQARAQAQQARREQQSGSGRRR